MLIKTFERLWFVFVWSSRLVWISANSVQTMGTILTFLCLYLCSPFHTKWVHAAAYLSLLTITTCTFRWRTSTVTTLAARQCARTDRTAALALQRHFWLSLIQILINSLIILNYKMFSTFISVAWNYVPSLLKYKKMKRKTITFVILSIICNIIILFHVTYHSAGRCLVGLVSIICLRVCHHVHVVSTSTLWGLRLTRCTI